MMRLRNLLLLGVVALFLFACNCSENKETKSEFPVLTGKYLGQTEPGDTPELFAPGIISTGMPEINAAFTPDYSEFYYSIRRPNGTLVLMEMKYVDDRWTKPEVASFASRYSEADPFITYDGIYLYYISRQPRPGETEGRKDYDLWRVKKINGNWGEPEWLGPDINTDENDVYPTLTKAGKLYYSSSRLGPNQRDLFYAEPDGDGFAPPVKLRDEINSHWEGDVFVSAHEEYLIFASFGRPAGNGLYICFMEDGQWTTPVRMSDEINMNGREFCPIVDPDGKYFFFTSSYSKPIEDDGTNLNYQKLKEEFRQSNETPQRGRTDVYWVKVEGVIRRKA